MTPELKAHMRSTIEAAELAYRAGYTAAVADAVDLMDTVGPRLRLETVAHLIETMKPSPSVEAMKRQLAAEEPADAT